MDPGDGLICPGSVEVLVDIYSTIAHEGFMAWLWHSGKLLNTVSVV